MAGKVLKELDYSKSPCIKCRGFASCDIRHKEKIRWGNPTLGRYYCEPQKTEYDEKLIELFCNLYDGISMKVKMEEGEIVNIKKIKEE